MSFERPCFGLIGVDTDQVKFLFPAAVRRARLQAKSLHFRRQVLARLHVAATPRPATLIGIAGYFDDDFAHIVRGNQPGCFFRCRITAARLDRHGRRELRRSVHRALLRLFLAAGNRNKRSNDDRKQTFQSHTCPPGICALRRVERRERL